MSDLRLKNYTSLEGVTMDLLLTSTGVLDENEELATAVRVALGTDKMADAQDILPDPDSIDRRGWWGDLEAGVIWDGWPIGTKNWLLERAKITGQQSIEGSTLERARLYTLEAMQPFLDIFAASDVEVIATRTERERIEVSVKLYRGPLSEIDLRYQVLWEEVKNPVAPVTLLSVGNRYRTPRAVQLRLTPYIPTVRLSDYRPSATQLTINTYRPTVHLSGWFPGTAQLRFTSRPPTVVNSSFMGD